jgi:hypothetical protein
MLRTLTAYFSTTSRAVVLVEVTPDKFSALSLSGLGLLAWADSDDFACFVPRHCIGAPCGTLRSCGLMACRCLASGNHTNGWDSVCGSGHNRHLRPSPFPHSQAASAQVVVPVSVHACLPDLTVMVRCSREETNNVSGAR